MRVVVTGGGTYGHVSPIEPIIESLRLQTSDKLEILFVAQKNDRFADLLRAPEHVDSVIKISAGKYRRYPNETKWQRLFDIKTHILNLRDIFLIAMGTVKAFFILRSFKPDVVFGKGGYVSVPVGWAARMLKIPLVIHESDTRPGMANKILSSYATTIALGLPTENAMFDSAKTVYTGIPVRGSFGDAKQSKADIKKMLKLAPDLPLITVSGGSLGAEAINNALVAGAHILTRHSQVMHITGEKHYEKIHAALRALGVNLTRYKLIGFTKDIDLYFKASDLVITRASATTFSELAILGKATILVPAKQLFDQVENARILKSEGVVERVLEQEIDEDVTFLANFAMTLIDDAQRLSHLEQQIKKVAKPNAATELAKIILEAK